MNWKQISYTFTLPLLGLIGCFTNGLSILVYRSIKLKTKFQIYGLICSVLHLIYLILLIISDITKYNFQYEYYAVVYHLYIEKYLTSCLAIMIILTQMSIFIQHYLLVSNKREFWINKKIRYAI